MSPLLWSEQLSWNTPVTKAKLLSGSTETWKKQVLYHHVDIPGGNLCKSISLCVQRCLQGMQNVGSVPPLIYFLVWAHKEVSHYIWHRFAVKFPIKKLWLLFITLWKKESLGIKALATLWQALKVTVLKKCVTDNPHQSSSCCTDRTLVISCFPYPQGKYIPMYDYFLGLV